jgi:hypothetical protein
VVLLHGRGLDEGRAFISELPRRSRPTTVSEAYEHLKPDVVQQAEIDGRVVLRQGEWFFVATDLTNVDVKRMAGARSLKTLWPFVRAKPLIGFSTDSTARGNQHVARHLDLPTGLRLATGVVRHIRPFSGRATHEHVPIRLGSEWWEVWPNTALRSWSTGGRFD